MRSQCPKCSGELSYVKGITNTHITGDEKYMRLLTCKSCFAKILKVSMDAWLSTAVNYFTFMVILSAEEFKFLKCTMEQCPADWHCECKAHGLLDRFDYQNKDRRIILEDEYEKYD